MLNNWSKIVRSGLGPTVVLAILLIAPTLWAQVNTSSLRGTARDADGAPIANADVTLVHEPSGNVLTAKTNASGAYAFNGLRVGGPYQVMIFAEGYEAQEMTEIYLSAGKREYVAMTLKPVSEVVEIIGTAPTPRTTSSRSEFGAEELNNLPQVGYDPKTVVRLTPEAYLEGDESAMSIGGQNSRFNSVTIDGIRQNDDFGLNANGYPTQRSPISMTAIEQITVETSPFDVRYANFLGGNVNIVTKSGTNEFKGSLVQTFSNEVLVGTETASNDILEDGTTAPPDELDIDFSEIRYGLTLGGPVIKDKVHFFVSVEGLDATTPASVGPANSGAANEVSAVSIADVARAQQIARDVYGFDAGVPSQALDETDLKLLTKLDWAISKKHRMSGKYQRTRGNVIRDRFFNDQILPLTSNWYNRDDQLHAYAVRLFSNWNTQLSTEFELSGKLVDNSQVPLNGNGFMAAEITTADGGTIVLGPDVFRHANKLDTTTTHAKAQANYLAGQHLVSGGVEVDRVSVFNKFVPFSNGDVSFDSLDDFENMMPSSIFYQNAVTNNPDDGSADWNYTTAALYAQDQWEINDKLTVQGGVRNEIYFAADTINENQNFIDRYGFTNVNTINGKFLVMPRLGVTFRPVSRLNLRGGGGLYSGGTPNVWVSNNYTNDGVTLDGSFSSDPAVIGGFNGYDIPDAMQQELTAGDGSVDVLDPDFKIPSSWKLAAGADYAFDIGALGKEGKDFKLKLDYTFTKVRHSVQWQDLRYNNDLFGAENVAVGELPDGRPYFDNDDTDGSSFNTRRGYDMLLTNTDQGHGHTLSLTLQKHFRFGLNIYAAYAYQNVKDLSPGTSSRAVSNYGQAAVAYPNDPQLGTSIYERRHRILAAVTLNRALLNDLLDSKNPAVKNLKTTLSVYFETRSGQPFSYTYGGNRDALAQLFGEEREFSRRNRMLFYVPDVNDPRVTLDGIDPAEFNQFLEDTGLDKYRGQIAPRNGFRGDWLTNVDLRFAQELVEKSGAKLIIDIQNFGNMLNSAWGRYEQPPFPFTAPVVDVNVDPATGDYIYSNLRTGGPNRLNVLQSVWRLQGSLMFEF